jgi:hypothetical protein
LSGGEISGNTGGGSGGGVAVARGGTFRIAAGTIHGSDSALRNTARSGSAIAGIAEYGTFSGNVWNRKGSLNDTDSTIRVVNGELR